MLEYDVVDVFAETPFAGNQLAVVHGAADLPDATLLAIAREFNYSETTFPTPVDGGRYRVRIFTPSGELPFAGHPTLGTAWVLREAGLLNTDEVVQECGAGDVGVRFDETGVELSATPRDLAGPLDDDAVAALLAPLGLTAADRDGQAWIAGTGLGFVHLPVTDEAVTRARLGRSGPRDLADLPATADPLDGINLYAVTSAPGTTPVEVHSRVFVLGFEDPATGSAAAGLGMALHARGILDEGGPYEISQGREIGRPSFLRGRVEDSDGAISRVRVAGEVYPIAHGRIRVPDTSL